jgi:DNA-nicking Smr family endonuclease
MNKIVYSYKSEQDIPETLKESYVYNTDTASYVLDGFAPKEELESYARKAEHIKADKENAQKALQDLVGDKKVSEVKAMLKALEEQKNRPVEKKPTDAVPIDEYLSLKEQLEKLLPDYESLKSYKDETEKERRTRLITDKLREEALKASMNADVIEDLHRYTSDFTVDDKGRVYIDLGDYNHLTPEKWIETMKEKKPSWFPQVVGGGMRGGTSGGGSLENPYLGKNRTAMFDFKHKHGEAKAKEYAKLAGKTVDGNKL